MKKILLLSLSLFLFFTAFNQTITKVDYFKWSDPITFKLSPSPHITGYGYYSDSLSNVFENKDFYEYNNEYFCIESWADYYYWYTKKYWHLFENPAVYEYYYWTKNDLGMASYIASYNYKGEYYPSSIKLVFKNKEIENRLATNKYIATNDREFSRLKDQKIHNGPNKSVTTNKKTPENKYDRGLNANRGTARKVQPVTRSTSVVTRSVQTKTKSSQ